jgi:abortive infection bacteriophage resistance protein
MGFAQKMPNIKYKLEYSLLYFFKYLQGVCMKFMDKIELVVKLKEKIAEAKASNEALALQLQALLDQIIANPQNSPAI